MNLAEAETFFLWLSMKTLSARAQESSIPNSNYKKMMLNKFQSLSATVVLLGQDNPPTCTDLDAKQNMLPVSKPE